MSLPASCRHTPPGALIVLTGFRLAHQINLRGLFSVENAVGRWIWKSGRTKAGGTVPWNLQSVNTDADNMHWEKDKCSITVDVPGLYEVRTRRLAPDVPEGSLLTSLY